MIFTPLTRDQLEAMPPAMRALRTANWQRIVDHLGRDHHARYHGAFATRLATRDRAFDDDPHTTRLRVAALEDAREAFDAGRWAAA